MAIHYSDPLADFEQLRPGVEPMKVQIRRILEKLPHVGAVMLSMEPGLQLPGSGGTGHARIYTRKDSRFPADFPLGEPIGAVDSESLEVPNKISTIPIW